MRTFETLRPRNSISLYFGKIASRGDFVKSTSGAKVVRLIDKWVADGMNDLLIDPGWKAYYDNAGPIDFLFLGTRRNHAICGALVPSCDSSSRRYPLVAATVFETDAPLLFLPPSFLVLEKHLNHKRALITRASRMHDAESALAMLCDMPFTENVECPEAAADYKHFLATISVATLGNALSPGTQGPAIRQMVLAIGYLLHSVATDAALAPQRGLALPIPCDAPCRSLVIAFWLDLISIFLKNTDFELSVFCCMHFGNPRLILTFNGVTPDVFRVLFLEDAAREHLIDITDSAWVEDYVVGDPGRVKLESYLSHSGLSLQQLVETFRDTFSH